MAGILLILGLSNPGLAPDNPITILLAPVQQALRAAGNAVAGIFQSTVPHPISYQACEVVQDFLILYYNEAFRLRV